MALLFSSHPCFSLVKHEEFNTLTAIRVKRRNVIRAAASDLSTVEKQTIKLGASEVEATKLGIGAWSWGDTTFWNDFKWDDRKLKAANAAFNASVDAGITFFDTAEVYGSKLAFGAENSESLLGRFIKERKQRDSTEIVVATKFAALPWRLGRGSVISALKDSLNRLGLSSVDVYQLHWPGIWGNEGYIDGLGDAVEKGLVKAVGVSNYNEQRLRNAYAQLQKRGIPLASNQVNYSLIYRAPEENGVKAACDELGITLIAYSPIGQDVGPTRPIGLAAEARREGQGAGALALVPPGVDTSETVARNLEGLLEGVPDYQGVEEVPLEHQIHTVGVEPRVHRLLRRVARAAVYYREHHPAQ